MRYMEFLKRWPARILMILLLLQAVAYYAVASRRDIIPEVAPLSAFPFNVPGLDHGAATIRSKRKCRRCSRPTTR